MSLLFEIYVYQRRFTYELDTHKKRTGQTKFSMRYIKEETVNDLRSKLHKMNEQAKYNYVATYMVEDVAKTFRHEANTGSFTPYQ